MKHVLLFGASILMVCGSVNAQDEISNYEFWASTDSTFIYLSEYVSNWQDARDSSVNAGGHLVTLSSLTENSLLDGTNGWIGLFQPEGSMEPDSGWVWVTGEPILFTPPWADAEPNDLGGEDCLEKMANSDWNDHKCTSSFKHFMELPMPPSGCPDPNACNYDPNATLDDGSCVSCDLVASFCGEGTVWDEATSTCIVANPADINLDGCVQLNDLLDLLTAYGDCGAEESAWQCGDPLEYQGYDYETVLIGGQCWFAENLRSENYENGDEIPSYLSGNEWQNTNSGAVAVYDENASSLFALETYGRLYNWYAVVDSLGLCPIGWHVPTDGEWMVMTDFLGGPSVVGGKMKTTYGWGEDGNGTNSSGFSALPGGYRDDNGGFYSAGSYGVWWSSSPSGSNSWHRALSSSNEGIFRSDVDRRNGYSIRCIKDAE